MTGEMLDELTLSSRAPSPAHSYFVAQHWEGAGGLHPDNSMRTKHGWLRQLKTHLSVPTDMSIWLWMDFVSAPTLDPVKRPLALRSRCAGSVSPDAVMIRAIVTRRGPTSGRSPGSRRRGCPSKRDGFEALSATTLDATMVWVHDYDFDAIVKCSWRTRAAFMSCRSAASAASLTT